jgi:hypothetical protein
MGTRKLELKDIAGYLPRGLKFAFRDTHRILDDFTLNRNGCYYNGIPILRPISDLYKTFTHNGKEIVPIVELAKIANEELQWYLTKDIENNLCAAYKEYVFNFSTYSHSFGLWNEYFEQYVGNQMQLFDYLHELKIDYRGLIDAGLAVDVNTLKINPYKIHERKN